jgi:nucleoid-associated protein YgaU
MNGVGKTILTIAIVSLGLLAATTFRRKAEPVRASPAANPSLSRRTVEMQPAPPPAVRLQTVASSGGESTVGELRAKGPGDPPSLARTFPQDLYPSQDFYPQALRWGSILGPGSRPVDAETAGTHRVVDGDTLRGLAGRYLGNPDRALEIYQANRDVLPNPEVLPIGVELKLPPRQDHSSSNHLSASPSGK